MPEGRKLTVVVGAGASYDCAVGLSTEANVDYKPPLVNKLFQSRKSSFSQILKRYPGAEGLAPYIRTRLQRKEGLETILKELASTENKILRRQFLEVPLYLQDLLYEVSENYETTGGTAYSELVRAIEASSYDRILYLTVNYDLLLEKDLQRTYRVTFKELADYTHDDLRWDLIKLHGSVNWGRQIDTGQGGEFDPLTALDLAGDKLQYAGDICVLNRKKRQGDGVGYFKKNRVTAWYPALSVPIEGKTDFNCPENHIEKAKAHLAGCTDFLVIGFSASDPPVLDLFSNVPEVEKLKIVNGNAKAGWAALEQFVRHSNAFRQREINDRRLISIYPTSPLVSSFGGGFSSFVASDDFKRFFSG